MDNRRLGIISTLKSFNKRQNVFVTRRMNKKIEIMAKEMEYFVNDELYETQFIGKGKNLNKKHFTKEEKKHKFLFRVFKYQIPHE